MKVPLSNVTKQSPKSDIYANFSLVPHNSPCVCVCVCVQADKTTGAGRRH